MLAATYFVSCRNRHLNPTCFSQLNVWTISNQMKSFLSNFAVYIPICPGLFEGGLSPSCAGRAVADNCALPGPRREAYTVCRSSSPSAAATLPSQCASHPLPACKSQFLPAVRVGASEFPREG